MWLVDKDSFSITNLNRQLFSTPQNIGQPKVDIVKRELLSICPDLTIETHISAIEELDEAVFKNIDIVFDAVDNIYCKIFIEKLCGIYNRTLIHGAIGSWYGQVGISLANSNLLKDYYQQATSGLEQKRKPLLSSRLLSLI
jgi:molybdopterin/thiamine biosynthesis adenylyltransferase